MFLYMACVDDILLGLGIRMANYKLGATLRCLESAKGSENYGRVDRFYSRISDILEDKYALLTDAKTESGASDKNISRLMVQEFEKDSVMLEQILEKEDIPYLWYCLAYLYKTAGRQTGNDVLMQKAIRAYKIAMKHDPDNFNCLSEYARLLDELGQNTLAIRELNRHLLTYPALESSDRAVILRDYLDAKIRG